MEKLLLIDDEVDVQYSFRRIFDASDIELHTASSGEEGLRIIPKVRPDLVLSDIRMADRKSTRLNSSHVSESRMPSSA